MKPRTDLVRVPAERSDGVPLVPCFGIPKVDKTRHSQINTVMLAVSPTRKKHTQLRIAKAPNTVPYLEFLSLSTKWTIPDAHR